MIRFPFVPQLADGQTLGATHLNAYRSAILYLLGESHGAYALCGDHRTELGSYDTGWTTCWRGYLYLASKSLYYLIRAMAGLAGKTWYLKLRYYGDDSAWHDAVSLSGAETSYTVKSATVDMSAFPGLTLGKVYRLEWQYKTSDGTYHTHMEHWRTCVRGIASGWAAPPAFAAGASSAAELNTLRDDAQVLYNNMVPTAAPAFANWETRGWNNSTSWYGVTHGIMRYRPSHLYTCIRFTVTWGRNMSWRVKLRDTADAETTVYTSGVIASTGPVWKYDSEDIDLTGFGFTVGAYYRVIVEAKRNESDDEWFSIQTVALARWSNGSPAAGWQALAEWTHGDQTVSAANLNKCSTDLTMLYSGNEALWGETPAVWADPLLDDDDSLYYIRHRKRWLLYYYTLDDPPTIWYGTNYGESQSLPAAGANQWHSYDLGQIADIPWGGGYLVTNVLSVMESAVAL